MLRCVLAMFGLVGCSLAHMHFTGALFSQFFAKGIGTSGEERLRCMIQTTDQGFALAGYTMPDYPPATDEDVFVLKLNSDGSLSWQKRYRGTDHECAYSIAQTPDGGYAVAGYTWSFGADSSDVLLMKLNPDGSIAWARRYGGTSYDYAWSMTRTADGGYALAGVTTSFADGTSDGLVLKVNSDGSLAWAKTFGRTIYADDLHSIIQTSDGGFAVAGRTDSWGAGGADVLVLKLNSDGSLAWAKTFGGTDSEEPYSIIQTSDGGYAVAGYTDSWGAATGSYFVLKLNSNGSLAWAKAYEGVGVNDSYYFTAYSIIQTPDGGYMVTGDGFLFGTGYHYQWIMLKLNPDGSIAWSRMFGKASHMDAMYYVLQSTIQTSDGCYVVTGRSDNWIIPAPPWSWGDIAIIKMDGEGNYPQSCFLEPYPMVEITATPSTSSPSTGATCSPSSASISPTIMTPGMSVIDICNPMYEGTDEAGIPDSQTRIICSPLPSGALFISSEDLDIKIYSIEGYLAYAGQLQKGENRIGLNRGVYIWKAGSYKGKVVVR